MTPARRLAAAAVAAAVLAIVTPAAPASAMTAEAPTAKPRVLRPCPSEDAAGACLMSDYFLTIDPADQPLYDWAREQNAGIPHWDSLSEVARDWWRRRHEQVTGAAS